MKDKKEPSSYQKFLDVTTKSQKTDLRTAAPPNGLHAVKYSIDIETAHDKALAKAMFGLTEKTKIYSGNIKKKAKEAPTPRRFENTEPATYTLSTIDTVPFGQELSNDFPLNLMDWSPDSNIYFALHSKLCVYLTDEEAVDRLQKIDKTKAITAVAAPDDRVVISTYVVPAQPIDNLSEHKASFSEIDTTTNQNLMFIETDQGRYSVMRSKGPKTLYAGNCEGILSRLDLRAGNLELLCQRTANVELMGMSIQGDLIAIGDEQNVVTLWDIKNLKQPIHEYRGHTAGVKALAFSPFNSDILASGGGTEDKAIHLFDVKKNALITKQPTGSQVCNLHWIDEKTLFTTHGFSGNENKYKFEPKMHVWQMQKDKNLKRVESARQQEGRVLFSTQNPHNPYQFFTGTGNLHAQRVQVDVKTVKKVQKPRETESVLSLYNPKNSIR